MKIKYKTNQSHHQIGAYIVEDTVFHDLYKSTHQLVITGDNNVPTESSHDDIILRPDVSTSHEESENCYQALAVQ